MIAPVSSFVSLLLLISLCAVGAVAQDLRSVVPNQDAAREAVESVDKLVGQLRALRQQIDRTMDVFASTKVDMRGDAVAEVEALERVVVELKQQVEDQVLRIESILLDGADGHPLTALQLGVAKAHKSLDPKKQESNLLKFKQAFLRRSDSGPCLAALHFEVGEARRRHALFMQTQGQTRRAEQHYMKALKDYEEVIEDDVEDVRDVVGSSAKASALYRMVQIQALLCISYTELGRSDPRVMSKAKAFRLAANENYFLLKENYPREVLRTQENALRKAFDEVQQMKYQ